MRQAQKNGRYMGIAPKGYSHILIGSEKRKVPVPKELFKEIIIGHKANEKTVKEIVQLRNKLFPSTELKKCFYNGQSIKIRKHE